MLYHFVWKQHKDRFQSNIESTQEWALASYFLFFLPAASCFPPLTCVCSGTMTARPSSGRRGPASARTPQFRRHEEPRACAARRERSTRHQRPGVTQHRAQRGRDERIRVVRRQAGYARHAKRFIWRWIGQWPQHFMWYHSGRKHKERLICVLMSKHALFPSRVKYIIPII